MKEGKKHIHFIAIGGSAMHNLAIALKNLGYYVTGSDDDIFEPSRTRLLKNNLLPEAFGWFPEKIDQDTESVILGMHARDDNPELQRAKELGIPIYSFPEYVYQASKTAIRVVIAGSHGKSTITSMILHVLHFYQQDFDYLVGAGLAGFENMVKLSHAPMIVLEGDEYLTSTLDRTPKFLRYNHNIGLVTGIAWDHINAFPTRESYIDQFRRFIDNTPPDGTVVYNMEDNILSGLIHNHPGKFRKIGYKTPIYSIEDDGFSYKCKDKNFKLKVFGKHNMQNVSGALQVLKTLGFEEEKSLHALTRFEGASNRLETVYEDDSLRIFKDFAHSPSKLKATREAVKERFPGKRILNCYELHTYSSLNKAFLEEYQGCFEGNDTNMVFINDHTLKIKKMPPLSDKEIIQGFNNSNLLIVRTRNELERLIIEKSEANMVLLFMSSGNWGELNFEDITKKIKNKIK